MSTLVLVHGSFSGAWPWEPLLPHLKAAGHHVIAPDLPGHGDDRAPLAQRTLASYAERVAQVIDAQRDKVVLVGHSMGGVVVTQTAEARCERISALVYLCAFLPRDGESLIDLARSDAQSQLLPVLEFGDGEHWLRDGAGVDVFFHDLPLEVAERAARRLAREPLSPVETPLRTTAARFGSVPRTYVECTGDRALGIDLQRRMHATTPSTVVTLDCGHFPQMAIPESVARILSAI